MAGWNAVIGAAYLVYGLYLLLFFQGGHYVVFFYGSLKSAVVRGAAR